MITDQYPLLLISEVITKVKDSSCFIKMDLRWGFNNIQICENNEWKAAFITLEGLFEPLVMQFGLCNAPSTFQRMVDNILKEEKAGGHVEVYIDDILVHTDNEEDNRYWMRRVLMTLSANKLFIWKEKCAFEKGEVEFLGMMI
jgi:hypothetical protein